MPHMASIRRTPQTKGDGIVRRTTDTERIGMKHGSGGRSTRRLIEEVFVKDRYQPHTGEQRVATLEDGAVLDVAGTPLVFTTDSHVIQPLFFPGGDIGRLAISGTVNDLAMMGATQVLGLSCAFVIEEGFLLDDLRRIQAAMNRACEEAGASIVTGDTKVMGRGEVDGLVINTSGVGVATTVVRNSGLRPGDNIIVTGTIADHGFAVMAKRHQLELGGELCSDVAPINRLIESACRAVPDGVVCMKDPTRGGVAGALFEMAQKSGVGIYIDLAAVPIRPAAEAASELLGIDPLNVANEGKAVLGVRPEAVDRVLGALREHPLGTDAAVIGRCLGEHHGEVILDTGFGQRLLPEPDGELLPRIC